MKLIDADARIEVQFYDEEFEEWSLKTCTVEAYLNYASEMPQIIDAVQVVRCGDCRNRPPEGYCDFYLDGMQDNDFCSYGERRNE